MKIRVLFALLFVALPVWSQNNHQFWDRQQKIAFAVTAGVRAADIAQSCWHLSTYPGQWRERWFPAQSCGAVAAWVGSGQATQTLAAYGFHKWKKHKIERVVPWVWVAPNAVGIGLSFRNFRHK